MGAIAVVVLLILLKTSINIVDVLERKKSIESGLEKLEFENLRAEIIKAGAISINKTIDVPKNTNSFIAFAEDRLSDRTIELDGVSVLSTYPNVSASTDTRLNITYFNFFPIETEKLVLNFSGQAGSPQTFTSISSGKTQETNFTFNIASNTNFTLWIYYQTAVLNITENFTIPVEIGTSKMIGYFDIRFKSERSELRDRFVQTTKIS